MLMLPGRNRFGIKLFDDVFNEPFFADFDRNLNMLTDIKETDDKYTLDINLPGYTKEDISVSLEDGYLNIVANKDEKTEEKDKEGKFIRRERYTGHCHRSYYIGSQIKDEDIKASYKDGTLSLVVPKKEPPAIEEKPGSQIAID